MESYYGRRIVMVKIGCIGCLAALTVGPVGSTLFSDSALRCHLRLGTDAIGSAVP